MTAGVLIVGPVSSVLVAGVALALGHTVIVALALFFLTGPVAALLFVGLVLALDWWMPSRRMRADCGRRGRDTFRA